MTPIDRLTIGVQSFLAIDLRICLEYIHHFIIYTNIGQKYFVAKKTFIFLETVLNVIQIAFYIAILSFIIDNIL